jgi:hypothetical protein
VRSYLQKTLHKNRVGGVAQGVGPKFKPQYCKKTKKRISENPLSFSVFTAGKSMCYSGSKEMV